MRPKAGQYRYFPRGREYVICLCERYDERTGNGEARVVWGEPAYRVEEDARRRVYELNGWKYDGPRKPRKK